MLLSDTIWYSCSALSEEASRGNVHRRLKPIKKFFILEKNCWDYREFLYNKIMVHFPVVIKLKYSVVNISICQLHINWNGVAESHHLPTDVWNSSVVNMQADFGSAQVASWASYSPWRWTGCWRLTNQLSLTIQRKARLNNECKPTTSAKNKCQIKTFGKVAKQLCHFIRLSKVVTMHYRGNKNIYSIRVHLIPLFCLENNFTCFYFDIYSGLMLVIHARVALPAENKEDGE